MTIPASTPRQWIKDQFNGALFIIAIFPFIVFMGQVYALMAEVFGLADMHANLPLIQNTSIISCLILLTIGLVVYRNRRGNRELIWMIRLLIESRVPNDRIDNMDKIVRIVIGVTTTLFILSGLVINSLQILGSLLYILSTILIWTIYNIACLKRAIDLRLYIFVQGIGFLVTSSVLFLAVVVANLVYPFPFVMLGLFLVFLILMFILLVAYIIEYIRCIRRKQQSTLLRPQDRASPENESFLCDWRKWLMRKLWNMLQPKRIQLSRGASTEVEDRINDELYHAVSTLPNVGLALPTYCFLFSGLLSYAYYLETGNLDFYYLAAWILWVLVPYLVYLAWRFFDNHHLLCGTLLPIIGTELSKEDKLPSNHLLISRIASIGRKNPGPYISLTEFKGTNNEKRLLGILVALVFIVGLALGFLLAFA